MTPATAERPAVEVLRAAKERISDPERWTTGAYARNERGQSVEPQIEDACQWCASGSLFCEVAASSRADDPLISVGATPGFQFLLAAATEQGMSVANVNDLQGHSAALALFDRAIELAEAAGSMNWLIRGVFLAIGFIGGVVFCDYLDSKGRL